MRRVLVIQLYRIGDVLQSFAVFRALRSAHPAARLDLLTDPLMVDAAALCPDIDRVLLFPRPSLRRLVLEDKDAAQAVYLAGTVVERLRQERYDLVVNLQQDPVGKRLAGSLDVPRTLGADLGALGQPRPMDRGTEALFKGVGDRRNHRRNLVDHFLEIAGMPLGTRGRVRLSPSARRRSGELLESRLPGPGPLVAIQSGTSRAFRGLEPEWIAAVQKRLPHARYAWLGSAAERPAIEARLKSGLLGACFAGETSIPEAAALIGRARLLVSGDTAAIHMAALLSTPSVSLFFGSAQPFETGPYGEGHACLYEPPECAPCSLLDGCDAPRCKTALDPDLLSRTCYAVLNGMPAPKGAWVSQLGPQGLRWERSVAPSPALRAQ